MVEKINIAAWLFVRSKTGEMLTGNCTTARFCLVAAAPRLSLSCGSNDRHDRQRCSLRQRSKVMLRHKLRQAGF